MWFEGVGKGKGKGRILARAKAMKDPTCQEHLGMKVAIIYIKGLKCERWPVRRRRLARALAGQGGTWKTVLCKHFENGTCSRGRRQLGSASLKKGVILFQQLF